MVIPVEIARKFFGREDVVGETVLMENFNYERESFVITGVLDEMSKNTVLHMFVNESPPILLPPRSLGRGEFEDWDNQYIVNYLELMPGVAPEDLEGPIAHLLQTHLPEEVRSQVSVNLEPVFAYYFNANDGLVKKVMWVLSLGSALILLMAAVNFINLSVGNASVRIREIGVRKAMGSGKARLFWQFMFESIMLSSCSMLLALIFYELSRAYFSGIFGVNLNPVWDWDSNFFVSTVALTFFIGFLAGIYPSFVLSAMPMVDSVKGRMKSAQENVLFRRSLIAFQMAISLTALGAAIIIFRQVDYFFNKELGYNKEAMVSLVLPREWNDNGLRKMETLRENIVAVSGVKNASISYELLNGMVGFSNRMYREGSSVEDAVSVKILQTDEYFAQTYQIKMAEGKFFQEESGSFREDRIVLNESAARALGYTNAADAVGEKAMFFGFDNPAEIGGIVDDFHFESLHEAIRPLAFIHVRNTNTYRYLNISTEASLLSESIVSVEDVFQQAFPGAVFEFEMMDDTLRKLYATEIRLKKSSLAATVIALIIVVMGVTGVVSLGISKRMKELGIRKVLGASAGQVIYLFLKEYIAIWLAAAFASLPLISALMSNWLEGFAYRIHLQWWMFALTGLVVFMVTALTVGLRSIGAAMKNPVESLRSE
jgi:putative ABC transport system permease protein